MLNKINENLFISTVDLILFEIDPEDGTGRLEYKNKTNPVYVDPKFANKVKLFIEEYVNSVATNQRISYGTCISTIPQWGSITCATRPT